MIRTFVSHLNDIKATSEYHTRFTLMIKQFTILIFALVLLSFSQRTASAQNSESKPIQHDIWDGLLKKYVSDQGNVNYQGFLNDKDSFTQYLDLLSSHHPNERHWNREEKLAYWINAYNAFTIQLILDHYPVESIKDIKKGLPMINSVWDIRFITIEGEDYDLNNIEHGILRKDFQEPRIHFAVNCASGSCPPLRNEAFTAAKLEAQLESQALAFIGNPKYNRIQKDRIEISKIFSWFKGDFTNDTSLISYLNRYSTIQIDEKASISYLEYDWTLND